jgi:hypothetical protein
VALKGELEMSEETAKRLMHFQVGGDGTLHLVMSQEIWHGLKKIAVAKQDDEIHAIEHEDGTVSMSMHNIMAAGLVRQAKTDAGPCPPVFQI